MDDLIKAIVVTAELTGTDLSLTAAKMMAEDLAEFPAEQVMGALKKCRRGLSGRLTVEAVISRIDDGRPGPEEAWALMPRSESATVVWTDEMASAYGLVSEMITSGEMIPARMAFIETYKRLCEQAREEKTPVKWTPSLGHDQAGREAALMDAARKGRLTLQHVAKLLPGVKDSISMEELARLANSKAQTLKLVNAKN